MNKTRFVLALLLTLSLGFVLAGIAQQKADQTATDPVCGMTVTKAEAKATFDYKGTTYYFCSGGCKEAFAKDPEKYLQKKEEAASGTTTARPCCGQVMPAQSSPHEKMMGNCPMMQMQHQHGQMAGQAAGMNCPLMSKDVERTIENLPDGVAIKITSKNPETVKKIQEHVAKRGAGAGCCCMGQSQAQEKK
jgi:YHS domain-containing protein